MNKEEFLEELEKINIFLTNEQLYQLEKFYILLLEWNKKINLTRITDKEEVYLKHFYDSLTIVKSVDLMTKKTLCDVGSGAGFPGIVLKIVFPHLKITLLDSRNKRIIYLNNIIKQLGLNNIEAVHTRSEDYNNKFDIITARAVASLDKLVEWCSHLVSTNGQLIAMKANIEQELANSEKLLKKYKCKISKIVTFTLPKENSLRNLVVIEKMN